MTAVAWAVVTPVVPAPGKGLVSVIEGNVPVNGRVVPDPLRTLASGAASHLRQRRYRRR